MIGRGFYRNLAVSDIQLWSEKLPESVTLSWMFESLEKFLLMIKWSIYESFYFLIYPYPFLVGWEVEKILKLEIEILSLNLLNLFE